MWYFYYENGEAYFCKLNKEEKKEFYKNHEETILYPAETWLSPKGNTNG